MLGFIAFPGGNRERDGEPADAVTTWLDRLPANYDVFHHVETSEGEMEHLVVSYDRGVFLVETSRITGRLTIDGGHLRQDGMEADPNVVDATVRKAAWLRRVLSEGTGVPVHVTPLVVFTGALVPDDGRLGPAILTEFDDLGSALTHARGRGSEAAARFWSQRDCLGSLGGAVLESQEHACAQT